MSIDKDSKTDKTEGEGNGSQKSSYGNKKGRRKKRSTSNGKFESSGNTFKGGPAPELKDHHVFTHIPETYKLLVTSITTAKAPARSHDRETIKALTPLEAKNLEFDTNKEYFIAAKEPEDNHATTTILFDKLWAQCDLGMQNKVKNKYSISDIEELIIRSQTDPNIKGKSMRKLSTDIQEVISEDAREVYLGTIFIVNANGTKYGDVADLCTMFDNYKFNPKLYSMRIPVVGHTYLSRGKKEKSEESDGSESDSSQDDNRVRNRYRNLICYRCGQKENIVTICKAIEHMDGMTIRTNNKNRNNTKDEEQQKGAMMLIDQSDSKSNVDETESNVEDYLDELDYNYQISWTNCMKGITNGHNEVVIEDVRRNKKHAFNQSQGRINPYWVLLDNQLTVHVLFCQKAFLTNI
eukprot:jgi/Psemu1/44405/gm1.44405_g